MHMSTPNLYQLHIFITVFTCTCTTILISESVYITGINKSGHLKIKDTCIIHTLSYSSKWYFIVVLSSTTNLKSVRFLSWYCGTITVLYYIYFWHAQCGSTMYMCVCVCVCVFCHSYAEM